MNNNTISKLWENRITEELNRELLFESVFTPKFKMFPRLCKLMKLGTVTHKSKFNNMVGDKIKINRI